MRQKGDSKHATPAREDAERDIDFAVMWSDDDGRKTTEVGAVSEKQARLRVTPTTPRCVLQIDIEEGKN